MFVLMKSRTSLKMGHVWSKTRSLGQIFEQEDHNGPISLTCTKQYRLTMKMNTKQTTKVQFLAHLNTECSVSYCDHSLSVRRPSVWPSVRPSVHNLLVNTLASTNINQSSPNLVKMYMTTRAQMTELIEPELSELSALELENLNIRSYLP